MLRKNLLIGSLLVSAAAGMTLGVIQNASGSPSSGLPRNGGNVDLARLPSEVLTVGPHGCVMMGSDGNPITVNMGEYAREGDSQASKSDEATPSTAHPGVVAGAKEDCSIDVDKAADLVAGGTSPREAIELARGAGDVAATVTP